MKKIFFLFLLLPLFSSAQIVEEIIQIDTTSETLKVIYKPEKALSYYMKKVAVFANDTSQIAIEKSYTNYGQNGVYKVFYPSGRLKIKTVFANNQINGEWTYYNPEGIIITKGEYEKGVKHGYWAYKSLRIYGRYKKGVKNRRWVRFDKSENKFVSYYRNGKLTSGEGYGQEIPLYLPKNKEEKPAGNSTEKDSLVQKDTTLLSKEYEQTISFLATNVMLRKAIKNHFGTSFKRSVAVKKTYDKSDRFQFAISKEIKALKMTSFLKESTEEKIVVAKIESILKNKREEIQQLFNGATVKTDETLIKQSTDKKSAVVVTFSEVKMNLLRLDIDWVFQEEKSKFRILLYFDDEGILKGAEYEKN